MERNFGVDNNDPKRNKRKDGMATCFYCKKKIKVGKNQHSRYPMCPDCKREQYEFGKKGEWIDSEFLYHGKRSTRWD